MFARLTSAENLALFRNRTLPLEVRFPGALQWYQAQYQTLVIYLSGLVKNQVRDSEMVELMGSVLRSTVVLLELVDEFLPIIRKDDPTYETRMRGLDTMKRGLSAIVAGSLQMLTERDNYRDGELARLVGYMLETFPVMVPQLPSASRYETEIRLEKMQDNAALKELQPGLRELHLKVKAALQTQESR
jgi:hypothetical protein